MLASFSLDNLGVVPTMASTWAITFFRIAEMRLASSWVSSYRWRRPEKSGSPEEDADFSVCFSEYLVLVVYEEAAPVPIMGSS